MGKNNQQRRTAKRRQRGARPAVDARGGLGGRTKSDDSSAGRGRHSPVDPESGIAQLLTSGAALAFGENAHDAALDQIVQSLVVLQSGEHPLLPARLATDTLLQAVGMLWENNWQPLDLAHIVRRHQGSRGAALAVAVIMEQAGREHATDRAPAEWVAQLESLAPGQNVAGQSATGAASRTGSEDWLVTRWQAGQGILPWDGWRDILRLIGQLRQSHCLTPLGPRPSQWDGTRAVSPTTRARRARPVRAGQRDQPARHDPRMLGKIRALLSKAEATSFAEEAEAFTTKAQDLMTRYAIDEALLDDSTGDGEASARRIHIDNPYAQAKVHLLSTVGGINRVRVIWDDHHGMATAVGMAVDLQLVEMLFTSLLVQATRALTDAGNARPTEPGYRSGRLNRSPSFRRAFLLAYASRIGERHANAGDRATADASASHGAELVPVLARRAEAVDTTFDRLFTETRKIRAKRVDARGWNAGREAADRAVFAAGQVSGS